MKRRILLVVANPTTATTIGWPVGFWAAELTHPCHAFTEVGFEVTIGGYHRRLPSEVTIGGDHRQSAGRSGRTRCLVDVEPFDAIVVAGGQSPLFTFEHEHGLPAKFLDFDRAGKIIRSLCRRSPRAWRPVRGRARFPAARDRRRSLDHRPATEQ